MSIPESASLYPDWEDLKRKRIAFDEHHDRMGGHSSTPRRSPAICPYYSRGAGRDMTVPKWPPVKHMFNHQTHHRGQVHCMLTQAGGKPHATDLIALPE